MEEVCLGIWNRQLIRYNVSLFSTFENETKNRNETVSKGILAWWPYWIWRVDRYILKGRQTKYTKPKDGEY